MATSGCGVKRSSSWSDAGSRGLGELGVSGRDGYNSAAQALDGGGRRLSVQVWDGGRSALTRTLLEGLFFAPSLFSR